LSSKKLELALAENRITGWEKAKYIFILTILGFVYSPFYFFAPPYPSPSLSVQTLDILAKLFSVLIIFYGIKRCFQINELIDHQSFIERLIILVVPIGLKIEIVSIPTGFTLIWIIAHFSKNTNLHQATRALFSIGGFIITYFYYFFLRRSFTRFSQIMEKKEKGVDGPVSDFEIPKIS